MMSALKGRGVTETQIKYGTLLEFHRINVFQMWAGVGGNPEILPTSDMEAPFVPHSAFGFWPERLITTP